jgi:hypothetical protein
MKLPRLLDGALIGAGLTSLWFFMGYVYFQGYDGRMHVPVDEIPRAPEAFIVQGAILSLTVLLGGAFALFLRHAMTDIEGPSESPGTAEVALVGLLAALFLDLTAFLTFGSHRVRIAGHPLFFTWGQVSTIAVFALVAVLTLRFRPGFARRLRPLAESPAILGLALILGVTLVAQGALTFGVQAASDQLWHVAPYQEVTFQAAPPSGLNNSTFFLVAQTPTGFYVRDLADVGGSDMQVRFIPEREIDGATITAVAGAPP